MKSIGLIEHRCANCGAAFDVGPKARSKKYCSAKCQCVGWKKDHPNYYTVSPEKKKEYAKRAVAKRQADPVAREKHNAENRAWKAKNREKINKQSKEYFEKLKRERPEVYEKHRQKEMERKKVIRLLNPKKRGRPKTIRVATIETSKVRTRPVKDKYCTSCGGTISSGRVCWSCRVKDDYNDISVSYDVNIKPSKCGIII